MIIIATSDTHGNLPDIPECDLFIHAGDALPIHNHDINFQKSWLKKQFSPWLERIPAKEIVFIAGNHDFVYEKQMPEYFDYIRGHYLQDSYVDIDGLIVYGTPWVPNLKRWAFYHDEAVNHYDKMPDRVDILVSHGPPYSFGDRMLGLLSGQVMHVGDKRLFAAIEKTRPVYTICGHIHEAFGSYPMLSNNWDKPDLYNVAYVDEYYQANRNVVQLEIP